MNQRRILMVLPVLGLLAGASGASAQRASVQATATVLPRMEAPTLAVERARIGGSEKRVLVVTGDGEWRIAVGEEELRAASGLGGPGGRELPFELPSAGGAERAAVPVRLVLAPF